MMKNDDVRANFSEFVSADTNAMDWQASPSPSVWRKRLDLTGPSEISRVTSVVRYDADSVFPSHPHPDGEEIFVLEGMFSDEHGDYPAGTFLLNPEGFEHAPFSKEGCVIFVKLRQYPGPNRRHVVVDTKAAEWHAGRFPGTENIVLYQEDGQPEMIRLVRIAPGATVTPHDHPGGEEVLVLDGAYTDEYGTFGTGSWMRYPDGSRHTIRSETGCTIYVKNGHLAEL